MRLARHRQLDALIGEYMLGSLRGGARRRFERALREEPAVALRLRTLQQEFTPNYSERIAQTPPAAGWQRLERELNLAQYRTPWYSRVSFLRVWAVGVTAALLLSLSLLTLRTSTETTLTPIAQLAMKGAPPSVTAALSADRRTLNCALRVLIVAGPFAKLRAVGDSRRRRADFAGSTWSTRRNTARARRTRRTFAQRCAAGDLG